MHRSPSVMNQVSVDRLSHLLGTIPNLIAKIPSQVFDHKEAEEVLSKKELFGQLIDLALFHLQHFTQAALPIQKLLLSPLPAKELVSINEYQEQAVGHLLRLWTSVNKQLLTVIDKFSLEKWDLPIQYSGSASEHKLYELFQGYLNQMDAAISKIFEGMTEQVGSSPWWHLGEEFASDQLENEPGGSPFITLMEHGSLSVELYIPKKVDLQTPHKQDEIYVILSGEGLFKNGEEFQRFQAGDVIMVPAGIDHRFIQFTDDFKTWVIFYGPEGGEQRPLFEFNSETIIGDEVFTISTNPKRLDYNFIHQYLGQSYWAKGRSLESVRRSLAHSQNFGLYVDNHQIGFARVVTDYTTFAYLADVFILDNYQGRGLGKWLIDTILNMEDLKMVKGWLLKTKDAHEFYRSFEFEEIKDTQWLMERKI